MKCKFLLAVILLALFFSSALPVFSQSALDQAIQKQKEIEQLAQKITELQQKGKSFADQIKIVDSQIELAVLKINQTTEQIRFLEIQIGELSQKIGILNQSLDETSVIFINHVVATYKAGKISYLDLLFSSLNFTDLLKRISYLRLAQVNDRKILITMEEIRLNYDQQKQEKETKQKQLEVLKNQLAKQRLNLDQQKKDKQLLLKTTLQEQKKYEEMRSKALAELQAIQAIIAGRGEEKEVGDIGEGEKIATIISGISPCSTGTHLHFEVHDGDSIQNPASYLKNIGVTWDNAPDGPFSFSGSWRWPINEPIRVTQGYGQTYYARVLNYYGGNPHTGIDVVNDDLNIFSVSGGKLYNGSIRCGSGYLRYVRVKHKDSNFSTYYLHVNYGKL